MVVLLMGVIGALTGCSTLERRQPQRPVTSPTTQTPSTPLPSPTPPPPPSSPKINNGVGGIAPSLPTFLNKELPKVGVILGAGGMKTFAHLGVLREMARARIPIHALAGIEWGAVMGGLYSVQGQVNEAEWKAFKLRESELPTQGGFLSAKIKPAPVSSLREFLETTFGSALMEKAKIDFACPSYSSRSDRMSFLGRGSFRDAMTKCVPYPPLFADNGGAMASPFAIEDAAAWLRSRGANVIVLVNVMGQGEVFPARLVSEQPIENLLWSEIRREMLRAKAPAVNWVINVNTTGHPITDHEGRRLLMDAGSKAATDVVNKMASQYGF